MPDKLEKMYDRKNVTLLLKPKEPVNLGALLAYSAENRRSNRKL
jgi:hypothetical protein